MLANPLTYGVDALRNGLDPAAHTDHTVPVNVAVTVAFCLVTFVTSWAVVNRRTNKPARFLKKAARYEKNSAG